MVQLGDLNFEIKSRGKKYPGEGIMNSAAGPVILPSPGWGLDCELKIAALEPFLQDQLVLCMTARGTYPSDRPPKDCDMTSTDMAHDLELLRQWLGVQQLRLYAHSSGGTIALGYAEMYPDRVSSLVLVSAKMLDHDDTPTLVNFVHQRVNDPRYTDSIAALMVAANFPNPAYPQNDTAFRELLIEMLPWYFANPEVYEPAFAAEVMSRPPPQNWFTIVHDTQNILHPTPNKALLSKVTAPTLIIVGKEDAFCTVPVAEIMHAGILNSELVVYEDCGHLPWLERKDDFTRKLRDWWTNH